MRFRFAVLVFLLGIPVRSFAHSEIVFARYFSLTELESTGFAFVNPGPTDATGYYALTVALITPNGQIASGPNSFDIKAGGQLAKLGTELFTRPPTGGWVFASTATEGVQAFWLNYDRNLSFLDGAESQGLESIADEQVIPLVNAQTEVNIVSPYVISSNSVSVRLYGPEGTELGNITRNLPAGGMLQAQISDLFPSVDLTRARSIRVRGSNISYGIATSALVRDFLVPTDDAVINGVGIGNAATELYFPHVISGPLTGANYTTVIGVTNVASAAQTVTITFTPSNGPPKSVSRVLAARGSLRENADELFGFPPEFQNGWVKVTGTAALSGFVAYADTVAGSVAVVPAGAARSSLLFNHIADGAPRWQTGIALLNATSTPAVVEVYAMTPTGALIGGASNVPAANFTIAPGQKIANVIHELIPQTRGVNGGFVFVRTTNAVPLYGIELFYTEDLKVLSNVAAGKLIPGVTFTPPR